MMSTPEPIDQSTAIVILSQPAVTELEHVLGPIRRVRRSGVWFRDCMSCGRTVAVLPRYPKQLHGSARERSCIVGAALARSSA